jgi:hypothetical protein
MPRMSLRSLPCALVCSALTTSIVCQTAPCLGMNDQNTGITGTLTAYALAGPTSIGWQFTPTQTLTVLAAQIYTRNAFFEQDMTLEIWSDGGNGLPLQRLGGGAWRIVITAFNEWQGANLDAAVQLGQGIPYWIVWTEPGTSLMPVEPAGITLPSARLPSGGAWTLRPADALKFRLFCTQMDSQYVVTSGTPCQGSGSHTRTKPRASATPGSSSMASGSCPVRQRSSSSASSKAGTACRCPAARRARSCTWIRSWCSRASRARATCARAVARTVTSCSPCRSRARLAW